MMILYFILSLCFALGAIFIRLFTRNKLMALAYNRVDDFYPRLKQLFAHTGIDQEIAQLKNSESLKGSLYAKNKTLIQKIQLENEIQNLVEQYLKKGELSAGSVSNNEFIEFVANWSKLQDEMSPAIQNFNRQCLYYNQLISSFPAKYIAKLFGYKIHPLLKSLSLSNP